MPEPADPYEILEPKELKRRERVYKHLAERLTWQRLKREGLTLTADEVVVIISRIALVDETCDEYRDICDQFRRMWDLLDQALDRHGLRVDVDEDERPCFVTRDGRRVAGFVDAARDPATGRVETVAGSEVEGAPRPRVTH